MVYMVCILQGKALNDHADPNVKVVVVGNVRE